MKKSFIIWIMALAMFLSGCSNVFAEVEYDSVQKIVQIEDKYAKGGSIFNPIEGGYSLTVSEFDGRQTLWKDTLKEGRSVEVKLFLSLTKGKAKIVHIDSADNVTTLMECTPETSTDEYVTMTVTMTGGLNRFKIVGYDCENIDLKILFSIE